jgi:hypothetical protein
METVLPIDDDRSALHIHGDAAGIKSDLDATLHNDRVRAFVEFQFTGHDLFPSQMLLMVNSLVSGPRPRAKTRL